MAATDTTTGDLTAFAPRPMRADARRNYDKLVAAARDAFAEEGSDATLEEISKRAGVGIGTLYRHFPRREDLLEATYLGGVEEISAAAAKYADLPPWEALTGWLGEFASFAAGKRALAEEMFAYLDRDAPVFKGCGAAIYGAGEPLLQRAQAAGEVRDDVDISDVTKMISGIAGLRSTEPEQIERLVAIALDGLRPPG
ncbi:MAG TPA: helix-turn-helix domain-containing protein [Solirubrobacterales bacterium]|nr:helix-turn-helix domain-containing protein [Solirubrobacterales bacterium]